MSMCQSCSETLRHVLEHSVSAVAVEHIRTAGLDWAADLEEDAREEARAAARRMLNHVARRMEVREL